VTIEPHRHEGTFVVFIAFNISFELLLVKMLGIVSF